MGHTAAQTVPRTECLAWHVLRSAQTATPPARVRQIHREKNTFNIHLEWLLLINT